MVTAMKAEPRSRRLPVSSRFAATLAAVAVAVGAAACSSGSATNSGSGKPAGPTTSAPARGSASSQSAQETVATWFHEVDAKNRAAEDLLAQPYRNDWTSTRTTSWPSFSGVSCRTLSESETTAVVRCSFVESRFTGEGRPSNAWDVHVVKQPDGPWLIARYGVS